MPEPLAPGHDQDQHAGEDAGELVTVKLIPKAVADLLQAHERSKLNRADITNRAIMLYEFLDAERAAGSELLIRRQDGRLFTVELI